MPSPRITLDQWSALVAVVEAGGYARAAERLHKSQSTVTYAVKQIESQLGVSAFEIEGRKAKLTATGELLYRRARYLVDEAASLEQASRRVSAGWEPVIAIAVESIFPAWLLLRCLDALGAESPHTRVEVIETVLGHLTDTLATRQADLGIYTGVPPDMVAEPLMRVRFLLVANPAHPLHRLRRKVTMRDLRQHRQLVVRESSAARSSPATVDATQRWTVTRITTSIEAARLGLGFAWLPEELIREELAAGSLAPLPMREGGERHTELHLVHADHEHEGPAIRRLAEIVRERVATECGRAASGR